MFNLDGGNDYRYYADQAYSMGMNAAGHALSLAAGLELGFDVALIEAAGLLAVTAGPPLVQGISSWGSALFNSFRGGGSQGAGGGDILSKPTIGDPKLQNIVNDLYKGTTNPNRIGTGTTADAIRNELLTGQSTSGRFHITKGQDYSRALEKWLNKNPNASYQDRLASQSLLDDLKNALRGK